MGMQGETFDPSNPTWSFGALKQNNYSTQRSLADNIWVLNGKENLPESFLLLHFIEILRDKVTRLRLIADRLAHVTEARSVQWLVTLQIYFNKLYIVLVSR